MVRLKKLQRKHNLQLRLRSKKQGSEGRWCTTLNCLACVCLLLNAIVLTMSLVIKRRTKEASISPTVGSATAAVAQNNPVTVASTAATQPALRSTVTPDTKAAVSATPAPTSRGVQKSHVIFYTDCRDPVQDWQAYLFFHNVFKSQQEGEVTHILTGCDSVRETALVDFHRKNFEPLGRTNPNGLSRFHVHFAPDHPNQTKVGEMRVHLKYLNRAFGAQHWMEKRLGYSTGGGSNVNDDLRLLMLDTDMVMLRPFGETFTGSPELWKKPVDGTQVPSHVLQGRPFAQHEPFPNDWWRDINAPSVSAEMQAGITRLKEMSFADLDSHYSAGPPFLATAKDMYPLLQKWNELTYPLYKDLGEKILREPHAPYALAATILNKPHQLADSFSVSNYRDTGFGLFQRAYNKDASGAGGTGALCRNFPKEMTPHVLQYSKRYSLGNFIIGKHYVQQNFLGYYPESCAAPLFAEPPENVAELFSYYKDPEAGSNVQIENDLLVQTMTFMVCETLRALNEAAIHYKEKNCPHEPNLNKTLTFDS